MVACERRRGWCAAGSRIAGNASRHQYRKPAAIVVARDRRFVALLAEPLPADVQAVRGVHHLAQARLQFRLTLLQPPFALGFVGACLDLIQAKRRSDIREPSFHQLARVIDRHAEIQPFRIAISHRRDRDHRAASIEHWPAAVAGVDRRVRLHERRAAGRSQRADNAASDAVLQCAERRSDDDDFLPGLQPLRGGHRNHRLRR